MQALPDDAECDLVPAMLRRVFRHQLREHAEQNIQLRTDKLFDDLLAGGTGFDHLTHHQPGLPAEFTRAKLTNSGWTLAMRMLRRHRLIEEFLVKTLDITWDRVHEEAEHMEHAVSDYLVDRIDEFLGRPEFDPHGDPIPTAEGQMRGDIGSAVRLTDCTAGTLVRFVRVTNQQADFLRYLSESGIEIGGEAKVVENNEQAGIVTAQVADIDVALSHATADALLVAPAQ
eukprot:g26602.t1